MDELIFDLLPKIRRKGKALYAEFMWCVHHEDLIQIGALAAWESIQKGAAAGRQPEAVMAYCMTKAEWSMLDAYRSARRRGVVDLAQVMPDADQEPSAQERAEQRQLLSAACSAADRLPPDQREVIRRLYVDDEEQAEAGAAMGVTQSRISQIHTKAIRTLRAALATSGDMS